MLVQRQSALDAFVWAQTPWPLRLCVIPDLGCRSPLNGTRRKYALSVSDAHRITAARPSYLATSARPLDDGRLPHPSIHLTPNGALFALTSSRRTHPCVSASDGHTSAGSDAPSHYPRVHVVRPILCFHHCVMITFIYPSDPDPDPATSDVAHPCVIPATKVYVASVLLRVGRTLTLLARQMATQIGRCVAQKPHPVVDGIMAS